MFSHYTSRYIPKHALPIQNCASQALVVASHTQSRRARPLDVLDDLDVLDWSGDGESGDDAGSLIIENCDLMGFNGI